MDSHFPKEEKLPEEEHNSHPSAEQRPQGRMGVMAHSESTPALTFIYSAQNNKCLRPRKYVVIDARETQRQEAHMALVYFASTARGGSTDSSSTLITKV